MNAYAMADGGVQRQRCDGYQDCRDGTDELDCPGTENPFLILIQAGSYFCDIFELEMQAIPFSNCNF